MTDLHALCAPVEGNSHAEDSSSRPEGGGVQGQLDAGPYRISNSPDGYGNPTYPTNSWQYTLNLQGAALTAPVPEPGTWLLFSVGLSGLGVVSRRRRAMGAAEI